ncbi:hypothetical protein ANN_08673, partial [Periplaneta americana]
LELPWAKLVSVATDGAPSMKGDENGFIGRLRKFLRSMDMPSDFLSIHCIIHREALCAKSVALNNVMSVVVNCVNFIKSSSLRNRQFKELLEELGSHYENVPYYCHVRWLSRGALLRRFFQLRCEINNFMKKQGHEVPELTQEEWLCDLAFSTDLFHHLDILNMSLQGKDKNVISLSDAVNTFMTKLTLWQGQLETGDLYHFHSLESIFTINVTLLEKYVTIIKELYDTFESKFRDLKTIEAKYSF